MIISSRQQSIEMAEQGLFGNSLRIWHSFEDLVNSNYNRLVTMRYKGGPVSGMI